MKKNLLRNFGGMFLLCATLLTLSSSHHAYAATKSWNGGTDLNFNFTDAENWNGGVAPITGDSLVFPMSAVSIGDPVNDMPALTSFAGIQFTGTDASCPGTSYLLTGNSITLTGDISLNVTGGCSAEIDFDITLGASVSFTNQNTANFQGLAIGSNLPPSNLVSLGANNLIINNANLNSDVAGSGNLKYTGLNSHYSIISDFSAYTGVVTVDNGAVLQVWYSTDLGSTTAVIVKSGGVLGLCGDVGPRTFTQNITINGVGANGYTGALDAAGCIAPGIATLTITLSGTLTLGSDTNISSANNNTLHITGPIVGNYNIGFSNSWQRYDGTVNLDSSSNGSKTANGIYSTTTTKQTLTIPVTDNQPTLSLGVPANLTFILDGVRADTTVPSGGILGGSGTVGILTVQTGGEVSPGHSPGCLNSGNLILSGSLAEEIGGTVACSGYDQIKVTGTVNVTGGTLVTTLYNGYAPKAGESYTIIDNDGVDAVTGTFTGLVEGATFTVGGVVFKISYVGGDGNDVVLKVLSVPATPNTGFKLVMNNPLLGFVSTIMLAGGILLVARKYQQVSR